MFFSRETRDVEAAHQLNVFLREVVVVNQNFTDFIFNVRILPFVGVPTVFEKLNQAGINDRLGKVLDFVNEAQNVVDFIVNGFCELI